MQHGPQHAQGWLQEALNRLVLQSDVLGSDNEEIVKRIKAAMRTVRDDKGVPSEDRIEKSIREYLVPGKDGTPQLKVDNGIGALTLAVVKLVLEEGLIKSINNQMVLDRWAKLKQLYPKTWRDYESRIAPFLVPLESKQP